MLLLQHTSLEYFKTYLVLLPFVSFRTKFLLFVEIILERLFNLSNVQLFGNLQLFISVSCCLCYELY